MKISFELFIYKGLTKEALRQCIYTVLHYLSMMAIIKVQEGIVLNRVATNVGEVYFKLAKCRLRDEQILFLSSRGQNNSNSLNQIGIN